MSRRVSSNRGRRLFKYSHRQFSIYRSDIRAYGYPHGNSLAVEGGEIVLSYHRSNKKRTVSRSRAIRESSVARVTEGMKMCRGLNTRETTQASIAM